jgi:hypothetical protein
MELWLVHVIAWLGILASGIVVGLGRWGNRKEAEVEDALAKARLKAART